MLTKALRLIGLVPASYVDAAITEHVRQEGILQDIIVKADVRYSKLMVDANETGFELEVKRREAAQATNRAEGLENKLATAPSVNFVMNTAAKKVMVLACFMKGENIYSHVMVAQRIDNAANRRYMEDLMDALNGGWKSAATTPG